jgi:hypothetical protein
MSERMTAEELIDGLKLIRDRFAVGVTHRRKIMNAAIDHLRASQTPDRTWFWEIVDRDGPQGLPSCEVEALRILINSYRASQTPPPTLQKDTAHHIASGSTPDNASGRDGIGVGSASLPSVAPHAVTRDTQSERDRASSVAEEIVDGLQTTIRNALIDFADNEWSDGHSKGLERGMKLAEKPAPTGTPLTEDDWKMLVWDALPISGSHFNYERASEVVAKSIIERLSASPKAPTPALLNPRLRFVPKNTAQENER